MALLVVFDFPSVGPYGQEAVGAYSALASEISEHPGLIWKVWTENPAEGTAGGVYLFTDEAAADSYTTIHTQRLASFGIEDITVARHEVNEGLTAITRGPLERSGI